MENHPIHTTLISELQVLLLEMPGFQGFIEGAASAAANRAGTGTSATVTVRRDRKPMAMAASDPIASVCDEAQYAADDGPCLEALDTGELVTSSDLRSETRWPAWREAALERGYVSVAAFPREVRSGVDIALNLYSPNVDPWDEGSLALGNLYADEVARAMHLHMRGTDQAELNADLRAALASRAVIDQAIGVILAQNRCSEDEALKILRAASQHRNVKLRDVAASIVEAVSGSSSHAGGFRARTP
ncbi:GAF and ANTAR domain-containing protein [Cellulomonas rhizosphaerae]|nr:GAF and ANTAR domain-containing protein [Cellulomonas rhizosphaerae]